MSVLEFMYYEADMVGHVSFGGPHSINSLYCSLCSSGSVLDFTYIQDLVISWLKHTIYYTCDLQATNASLQAFPSASV